MLDTRKYSDLSLDEITEILKGNLPEKRFIHSLNVAERAVFLAWKYGADTDKAYFAGLVHDICKGFTHEEQHRIIESAGIRLDEESEASPKIWHATAGSVYIRDRLGVKDPDIINAVRYHTTGRAGMSILEKVIYMADLTSRERDYPDAEYTRRLTDHDLLQGMKYGAAFVCKDLKEKGRSAGPDTENLMEELKEVEITYLKDGDE